MISYTFNDHEPHLGICAICLRRKLLRWFNGFWLCDACKAEKALLK